MLPFFGRGLGKSRHDGARERELAFSVGCDADDASTRCLRGPLQAV